MAPDAVILSPHFDDAVLSCWHVLVGAGEVLVVNVFAGEPPSGTLGWWDRLAGATDSAAVVRMRAQEDSDALALAGCSAVNLPFLDSQYRTPEQDPREILEALRGMLAADAPLYAPASLGDHHRDHTAVRWAAMALHAEGATVGLYADLPHATVFGWPRWVLNGASPAKADPAGERWAGHLQATGVPVEWMLPTVHRLAAEDQAAKLDAVRTYGSQLAPLRRVFGTKLEDPRLLGLEVDWRLPLTS